jgi:hypothetical protein
MTDLDLARRAVACRDWRWMPGMATTGNYRLTLASDDQQWFILCRPSGTSPVEREGDMGGNLPDLSDPATIGCLLQLVRDALNDPRAYCRPYTLPDGTPRWSVISPRITLTAGDTEAAALVAALEAAP